MSLFHVPWTQITSSYDRDPFLFSNPYPESDPDIGTQMKKNLTNRQLAN